MKFQAIRININPNIDNHKKSNTKPNMLTLMTNKREFTSNFTLCSVLRGSEFLTADSAIKAVENVPCSVFGRETSSPLPLCDEKFDRYLKILRE